MIDPKTILVTGGNGRLGKALGQLGCTALGRAQLDVTSLQSLQSALDTHAPKLIINCAAYTGVDRAETEQDAAYAINRDGAKNLAAVCAAPRIPLIHISTDCVFGDGDILRPVTENDQPAPLSVYGQSKLAGEQAISLEGRSRVCIARISWLFDQGEDTFIGKMLAHGKTRDAMKIVDDAYGRPTPVAPLADMLLKLAARMIEGMPVPEILHIGPQNPVNRFQWAKAIFAQSAALGGPAPRLTPCSSDTFPEPARRPRGLILDIATANALLGHMPDWRDANADSVAQLLANTQASGKQPPA